MSAVAAEGISVYAGGRRLLDHVSFAVREREWVSILGPNGAGKTTVLRALAGLTRCRGCVHLLGERIGSLAPSALARLVALVPQRPIIPLEMTVAEYVLLGRTAHLHLFAQEGASDLGVARAAIARLQLERFSQRQLGSLSGGELQRALIARALAQQAPILLLDEPTASLDLGHQQEVLELVEELRRERGLTVIAAVHDLTVAAQYGERIILLDAGRMIADGEPATVLSTEQVEALYGASVRLVFEEGRLLAVVPLRRELSR